MCDGILNTTTLLTAREVIERVGLPPAASNSIVTPATTSGTTAAKIVPPGPILDEHQAMAIDHRVKAGITKVDLALAERRGAHPSVGTRAFGRHSHHLGGNVR